MDDYGFIVPSYILTEQHLNSLKKCVNSIMKYHSGKKIVIIKDYKSTIDICELYNNYDNIIIENNTPKVPAEMLVYYYIQKNKYFDVCIFIQDSMELREKFVNIDNIKDIKYLWHCTNHRIEWEMVHEPTSEYNTENNIITHNDLLEHCFDKYIFDRDFLEYCKYMNKNKNKWVVCLGTCSLITPSFLDEMDRKTGIIKIMMNANSRRLRMIMESLFSLACQFSLNREIHESYDGCFYDGMHAPIKDGLKTI